jgi:hypothetical protein
MDVSIDAPKSAEVDMTRSRWAAVGTCTVVVGAAVGLLSLVLYRVIDSGDPLLLAPIAALVLLALTPFVASWLSGRAAPLVAGAGGLALGIGATVVAAALDQGGTGAFPVTMGVAVAGLIALHAPGRTIWGRVVAIALLAGYALASGRLISAAFVYPLFGVADEIVESFGSGRPAHSDVRETTAR